MDVMDEFTTTVQAGRRRKAMELLLLNLKRMLRSTSLARPHIFRWLAIFACLFLLAHNRLRHHIRHLPGNDGLFTTTILNRNKKTVVVDIVAENRTVEYTYKEHERYYKDLPEWLDRYSFLPAPNEVPDDQRVCLVHVGKTAGNTLCCFMGYKASKCNQRMTLLPGKLPRYSSNILHVGRDSCQREAHIGWYLFTLRDPLHRLMSWFTYERPAGPDSRSIRSEYRFEKIKLLYIDCGFDTMNQLGEAMSLLNGGGGGGAHNGTAAADGSTTTTTEECAQRAWRAVTGEEGYAYHNQMNYGYYWNQIPNADSARMAAIRTEYLEQDWYSMERLLDSSGSSRHNHNNATNTTGKPAVFGKKNESTKKKQDTELSELARQNVCAGLCEEIQIYKRILHRAANLSPADVQASLALLEQNCPREAVLDDECPPTPA